MTDLEEEVEDAARKLRYVLDDAGVALPSTITERIEELIAAKIAKALGDYSDLVQDATGIRP